MNRAQTASTPAPRPKINRLPAKQKNSAQKRPVNLKSAITTGSGVFALALALMLVHGRAALPAKASSTEGLPGISVSASSEASVKSDKTIILSSGNDVIIGQMSKIPPQPEQQVKDIKVVSDIDNRAGRDLLTIISQY